MSRKKITYRPYVRRAALVDFIERQGRASVNALALRFLTSPETIRRDLNVLTNEGQLQKIHGGAVRMPVAKEGPLNDRLKFNMLAKQLAAEKLGDVVFPGDSLFIDTGSTTLIAATVLARIKNLTVITNATRIADVFARADQGAEVVLLGGTYNAENAQTVGPVTCGEIGRYCTDHAILTIGTLNETGAFDYSQDEALIARAMMTAAKRVIVVADSSKLGKTSTFQVCPLERIDMLVLDKPPPQGMQAALQAASVAVK